MIMIILRVVAIAIACAAIIDPAVARDVAVTPPLTIVSIGPTASTTSRLATALNPSYDVAILSARPDDTAAACPSSGACIVVSPGAAPRRMSAGATVIGGVGVGPESDVVITDAQLPSDSHLHGGGLLRVSLRTARAPRETVVRVLDDGVVVGEGRHLWKAPGSPADAAVPVEWAPLAPGVRRLRIVVGDGAAERRAAVDLGVFVHAEPSRVLVYEPEATWLGTFVRRALEQDARLIVNGQTRLAPGLNVSRGTNPTLSGSALADVRAVVIGRPAALSAADVALLRRFVAVRGGSLIVLLEGAPSGPIAAMLPSGRLNPRRATPQILGLMRASEFVSFAAAEDVEAIESIDGSPVIASRAVGRGRVIAFGALDAWQHRDDQFARFWSALLADVTAAAGPTLSARVQDPVLRPGATTELVLEWRGMEDPPSSLSTAVEVRCADAPASPVRMWPTGRPAVFRGVLQPEGSGVCEVRSSMMTPQELVTSTAVMVADDLAERPTGSGLAGAVAQQGGIFVESDNLDPLLKRALEQIPDQRTRVDVYPMRSVLWFIPFAASLCAEWWLRRRQGLR